jgi:hypothetical protein
LFVIQADGTIVPRKFVKNSDDRLAVLNRVARSVVNAQRGSLATRALNS